MYLKSLELFGFKSFADKTRLDFEPGTTAVVGPNGCGKSNVVDAVRWCLGEQSAKSMRSSQMLDVIFGGSEARQTTGMSEVSLTFDNSQNKLPIDYSEVQVTRRLFRSGESEYFINKSQCRLKDVRDLFLDTGIGSEGYSVIEQGKVEFIISAKPEERREMFEEAAGVSKYKVRREETLRKLEKVEVDMNRVNDMLVLLKEQIASLDIAAKKARQYQKSKDELKSLEIASIVQEIISNQNEIDKIKNTLTPKEKEFEISNSLLNKTDAQISEMRLLLTQKDDLYIKLQDEFSQIKAGISLSDEKIRQSSLMQTEAEERRGQLSSEIESSEVKIKSSRADLEALKKVLEHLNTDVNKNQIDFNDKESQLTAVNKKLASAIEKANSLKSNLTSVQENKDKLGTEHMGLKSMLANCQAQEEALSGLSKELQEQSGPFTSDVSVKEKAIESFRHRAAELKADFESLQAEMINARKKIDETYTLQAGIKEKIVSAESKRQTLKEWETKDPVRAAINALKDASLSGITGPVSSLVRIRAGMQDTITFALGEKLDFMIAESTENAKSAIKYLEDNNLGRLTFVAKDRIPAKGPLAFFQSSGKNSIAELIEYDKSLESIVGFLCEDILVEGTTVYKEALISGGGKSGSDKPVLIDEQYGRLNADIASNEQEFSKAESLGKELKAKLAELEERSAAKYAEHEKANFQLEFAVHQLSETKERISGLQADIAAKQELIKNKLEEKEGILKQVRSLEAGIHAMNQESEKVVAGITERENEITSLREEEQKARQNLSDAKVKLATLKSDLEGRQREEAKAKDTASSLLAQIEQDKKELDSTIVKISQYQKVQKEEAARITEMQKSSSLKEAEVQVILNERQKLMADIEIKSAELHKVRQKAEELKQEIHDAQMDKRSFELQIQSLEKRLSEDYTLKFEEVKDKFKDTVIEEAEMLRLKKRIESLGNVNLAAPEEYASLEERYNFLLSQQQDLSKAKEDLHEVIRKINQSTKENFKKTFDQVRDNFKSIYGKLFEGGVADIILTDESNILESGVEINAQPPGKRLQNMSMMALSGGEKALTAIALLFAFFMVRPSPFCILDEADAPLDDANIGRFINLIKEFSKLSQFLIITHNKRTMEMADILYGVTMEEFGVSKVISVRLSKENAIEEGQLASAPLN